MNWQLYKRNLKTGIISVAHPLWMPMTESEAHAAARAYSGTYQPKNYFFAAKTHN